MKHNEHEAARCRRHVRVMENSFNNQGYVIGNIESGITVTGVPSMGLCTKDDGLSNDFWVSGFEKQSAEKILKKYPNEGFSIHHKIDWYLKMAKYLETLPEESEGRDPKCVTFEASDLKAIPQEKSVLETLYETCTRQKEMLDKILHMSEDNSGREGCIYGDTDMDSVSVVFGYNLALNDIKDMVRKELKLD